MRGSPGLGSSSPTPARPRGRADHLAGPDSAPGEAVSASAGPQAVRGEAEGRGAGASPGRGRRAWRPAGCRGGQPRAIDPRGRGPRRAQGRLRTRTRPPLAHPPSAHAVRGPPRTRARPSLPAVTFGRARARHAQPDVQPPPSARLFRPLPPPTFNGTTSFLTSPPCKQMGSSTSGDQRKRRAGHVVQGRAPAAAGAAPGR